MAYKEQIEWEKFIDQGDVSLDGITTRRGALLCYCKTIDSDYVETVTLRDGSKE